MALNERIAAPASHTAPEGLEPPRAVEVQRFVITEPFVAPGAATGTARFATYWTIEVAVRVIESGSAPRSGAIVRIVTVAQKQMLRSGRLCGVGWSVTDGHACSFCSGSLQLVAGKASAFSGRDVPRVGWQSDSGDEPHRNEAARNLANFTHVIRQVVPDCGAVSADSDPEPALVAGSRPCPHVSSFATGGAFRPIRSLQFAQVCDSR
jgi:hypothetical protein